MFEDIFHRRKLNIEKLQSFGFEMRNGSFEYTVPIMSETFLLTVSVLNNGNVDTRLVEKEKADINIKNHPFKLFGLMLPSYNNGKWDHTELVFPPENHTQMCFPDENYNYDPDYHRQGIGSALVSAALEALRSLGIPMVALVVFERNQDGNAFWEKQGFTVRTDLTYRNKVLMETVRKDT